MGRSSGWRATAEPAWPGESTRPTIPAELELDASGRRLRAALAAVLVCADARELRLVHDWLDSWAGIGRVAAGMHRQGYDLRLMQYDDRGWRATFYASGMEHSPLNQGPVVSLMDRPTSRP
jgi:hypothetical protein